jgi:hypothetical protein
MGVSSEQAIQTFITTGLLGLADADPVFKLALMRTCGVAYKDLPDTDPADVLTKLAP